MEKRSRLLALCLAVAVCFVILSSVVYISIESSHTCIGKDCPVCAQINACENALKKLSLAGVIIVIAVSMTYLISPLQTFAAKASAHSTLITLKAKLSN